MGNREIEILKINSEPPDLIFSSAAGLRTAGNGRHDSACLTVLQEMFLQNTKLLFRSDCPIWGSELTVILRVI